MPHRIKVLKESKIIKITFFGSVSLDERRNTITEMTINYITSFNPKILLDSRNVSNSMSETEQIIWGNYIATREELRSAMVAVVYNVGQSLNTKALKTAQQAGHNVKKFDNENDAMKWLCEQ